MIDPRILENEKRLHIAIKEQLRADDLDIDERTLADTVEGLTDFHEILAALIRAALKDETEAAVLKVMLGQMTDRLHRFEARADKRREMARDAMEATDLMNLTMPDFTASVRKAPPHLVIVDEAIIPQDYIIQKPTINKRAIANTIKDGGHVEGAAMSNPGNTLSIRTR
jgi:hypothetical protein